MKLFIIPDVHQNWKTARKLRESKQALSADTVVWLGDFLDDFDSTKEDFVETLRLVREVLECGDKVLFGNHDIQYIFGPRYICSGYQSAFKDLIDDDLKNMWREKGSVSYWVHRTDNANPLIMAHAGFTANNVSNAYIYEETGKCQVKEDLVYQRVTQYTSAGRYRGGKFPVGGPLWLDWNKEFCAVSGYNQVVGHTRNEFHLVRECHAIDGSSINFCIDNGLQAAMLLDTETMEYEMVLP